MVEDKEKNIAIRWEGKVFEADDWDTIFEQVSIDPWFGNIRELKKRVKSYYGYSLGDTRTKKALFKKLAGIGEIEIIRATV